MGKKQDKAREGREKYITSDEMQTYIDNHNKSIEGWNDTESIYDSRSKKDIQDCYKFDVHQVNNLDEGIVALPTTWHTD